MIKKLGLCNVGTYRDDITVSLGRCTTKHQRYLQEQVYS